MMNQIQDLNYEIHEDGINLEQSGGCGEVDRVFLHRIHIRLLAEESGLLAPTSNLEADRTIARLCRQIRILHHRINTLDDWLNQAAQKGHEDLSEETAYSFASWELSSEFCTELPMTEQQAAIPAAERRTRSAYDGDTPANPPNSGGVAPANPPNKGAVSMQGGFVGTAQQPLGLEVGQ